MPKLQRSKVTASTKITEGTPHKQSLIPSTTTYVSNERSLSKSHADGPEGLHESYSAQFPDRAFHYVLTARPMQCITEIPPSHCLLYDQILISFSFLLAFFLLIPVAVHEISILCP